MARKADTSTPTRRYGLSIPIGRMRSTVDFYAMSTTPSQDTQGSLIPADWEKVATTRAYARRITGAEYYQMLQFGHRVDAKFIMRWFMFTADGTTTTPTEAMRISWNDDIYRIIKVNDPEDLHIELQIEGLYISKQAEEI